MVAGTFATTAFAYTGDDVQTNTSVSTAAQEADAAGSANAGKTDNTDSIEIDPDMWSLLASFADVAGINSNRPSSLFTKEALGK